MNDNQIINISGVSCYEKDGTAYLDLEAVARGLGFTTTQTIDGKEYINVRWKRVDEYLAEIGFATCGKRPDFIPENIFYRLAMKAKNEAAEKFQAKIADEVIPSIRKHGMYATEVTIERMLGDPDAMIKVLTALKEEREQRKALESKVETTDPRCSSPTRSARPTPPYSSATWLSSSRSMAWTSDNAGCFSGCATTATSSGARVQTATCLHSGLWSLGCSVLRRPLSLARMGESE